MMRLVRRRIPHLILLLAIAAGCADRDDAGEPGVSRGYGGTIVVASNAELDNLNALVAGERFTQEINRYALFLPLVRYDEDLGYEPALAERWEMLGDTGVVFHLRRDVRWHDGTATTARDVLFTFERARDPETAFPNADYFALWRGATAPDSFSVRFSFEPHVEPLAGLPFLPVMPAHLLDSIPAARMRQAAFNRDPVGNGPFRFVEYRANDRWVFEANPEYPDGLGGRPFIDRLVWRPVPDQTAQVTAVATGAADMALTPPADAFAQFAARRDLRGIERPGRQYASVIWNGRVAPLGDARVRHALTLAIDRHQILESLRGGYGDLAVGPIGPFHWAHDDSIEPLPFDPDSARALLAAVGIRDRDGDGVLDLRNGRPFGIELKIPAGSQLNRDMAELIRGNLAAIGVRMSTRPVEFATLIQDFTSPDRNFEALILGWESDFRLNLRDLFHTDAMSGPFQIASYSNPRVDALLDRASVTGDRGDAKKIYSEIQRILRDEQPWTFLYYYPDLVLVQDRVRGADMDIRGALVNVAGWWVTNRRRGSVPTRSDSVDRSHAPDSAPGQ